MSTPLRIVGFVTGLVVVFGAAFGIGRLVDDGESTDADQVHAERFRLVPEQARIERDSGPLRFTIQDEHGEVVTDFDVRQEKRLHLIAVGLGFADYEHLHPTMAADGTWSTPIVLTPGNTRLYADFRPAGGDDTVATANVQAPGPLTSPAYSLLRSQKVDGFTVSVLGDLEAGRTVTLRFEVSRNGVPVMDLQPYLGAYGHLVVLRDPDGSYLHVHPEDGPSGPTVSFAAEVPSRAKYHLYLDFKHDGVVRTVQFLLEASATADSASDEDADHGDH